MYKVRRWTARHSRFFESFYHGFESVLLFLHPLFQKIGYRRLERPTAAVEKVVKGFLFDSQMCGLCTLSSTGMVCPMNCPKTLRNGPCGGVRSDGMCEVQPRMRCVWIEAYEGSARMRSGGIDAVRDPVDWSLAGTSSWLRFIRESRPAR